MIALVGVALYFSPGTAAPWLSAVRDSHESYLPPAAFTDAALINDAGTHAGLSLVLGGVVLAVAGAILLGPGKPSFFQWGVPALVVAEMIGFVAGK